MHFISQSELTGTECFFFMEDIIPSDKTHTHIFLMANKGRSSGPSHSGDRHGESVPDSLLGTLGENIPM